MQTYEEVKTKVAKDLQDDKAYLKHCLEHRMERSGLIAKEDVWWMSGDTIITVAKILERYGQFKDIAQVIGYFEKPYKFEQDMKFIIEEM